MKLTIIARTANKLTVERQDVFLGDVTFHPGLCEFVFMFAPHYQGDATLHLDELTQLTRCLRRLNRQHSKNSNKVIQ